MPGRERLLASLVELSGRSSGRTRADVLDTTLSLALLLTEADGAVLVFGGARAFERSVLRRGESKPDALSEPYHPVPFERSVLRASQPDRKSTRLNSSHSSISYAVFCLKKKKRFSRN